MGHEITQVTNILYHIIICPLPLLQMNLNVAKSNSDILKIDLHLYARVKIELRKEKLTPFQCRKRQTYFHKSNFGHLSPHYIKCENNNHLTVWTVQNFLQS